MLNYALQSSGDLPLTIEEVRAHLRIRHTKEDALLGAYLAAAVSQGERYTGRAFRTQVWQATGLGLDVSNEIRKCPIDAITQLRYLDTDGDWNVIDAAVYYLSTTHQWSYFRLAVDQEWPNDAETERTSNFIIDFTVAPAEQDYLAEAKLGVLTHVAFMNENRGDNQPKENGIEASGAGFIYDKFRIARV